MSCQYVQLNIIITCFFVTLCFLHGLHAQYGGCDQIKNGGFIHDRVDVEADCHIRKDLTVTEEGILEIKPGVTMRFDPAVVLGINGTLIAKGTPNNRIIFTRSSPSLAEPQWPKEIRLVDDHSVHIGRLEMHVKGDWRGVCAKNVNWTQTDVDVACKSLGFHSGNFTFGSWARNHTKHVLIHKPGCKGREASILDCKGGMRAKVGKTICANQAVVHLYCRGVTQDRQDYWGGIEFYNTTIFKPATMFTNLNETTSLLHYLDILYAGLGKDGNSLPSLRADPHSPHLFHSTIQHSLLDATNFTNVMSSVKIYNCSFRNNRGHGLAVESHMGHVKIENSYSRENYGNGMKVKFLNGRFVLFDKELTFCRRSDLASQSYPLMLIAVPYFGNSCFKRFDTVRGHRLTVNVLEMDIEPGIEGWLNIYDGSYDYSPLIGRYPVINNTLPMGITTSHQYLFIKFEWRIPAKRHCPSLKTCVKAVILIDSSLDTSTPELFINNTISENNLQHGFFIENIRNYVIVNASRAFNNQYGAGVAVYGGAGDILINSTLIERNRDNGVNITTEGGWRTFNHTRFLFNWGNGANITMNETSVDNRTRYSRHQRTEVSRSFFLGNLATGLSVGNYCSIAIHVVNDSIFRDNHKDGISFLSCLHHNASMTNFTAAYNIFDNNGGHAIRLSPLANAVGRIANNTFKNHKNYVLLIDNSDDFRRMMYLQSMPVKYEVEANIFENNGGLYVAQVRLVQGSTTQKLFFRYNRLVDNLVKDKNGSLNQRSRSRAVIIVSSDNVLINRNFLSNPQSSYQVSTHLQDVSCRIDFTANYWSTTDYHEIIEKIFDQNNRYNLARISYHPVLKHSWLYGPVLTDREIEIEIDFERGQTLGGRLVSDMFIPPHSTFYVDRDLNINRYGRLYVKEGATIEFENSLAMVVQGMVVVEGTTENPVVFKLKNQSTWINQSRIRLVNEEKKHLLQDGIMEESMIKEDGVIEGWLEVWMNENVENLQEYCPNGTWGAVCKQGWGSTESAIACQMMGLIHHPEDNPIPPPNSTSLSPIFLSDITCTDLHTDLFSCEYELEHSCSSGVYLMCRRPGWSGINVLGKAHAGSFVSVEVTEAGLTDPSISSLSPALTIDFNLHQLKHLNIHHNLQDAIHILKNDPYTTSHVRQSHIHHNRGNGVVVTDSFFELKDNVIENNGKAGFLSNPSITAYQAFELRKGIHDYTVFDSNLEMTISEHSHVWIMTKQTYVENHLTLHAQFSAENRFRLLVDMVDYNPDQTSEKVTVYDTRVSNIQQFTKNWQVDEDLVDFPVLSQSSVATVRWKVLGMSSGRLTFIVRSVPWDWDIKLPYIRLQNNIINNNHIGAHFKIFNHPSDEYHTLFHRFNWEQVSIERSNFSNNVRQSVLLSSHTKHNPLYLPSPAELQTTLRVAEIAYRIRNCIFKNNGEGFLAHHPDIGFANSVWIFEMEDCRFLSNRGGGLVVEFPKINLLFTELFNNSFNLASTIFKDNINFQATVGGFYCNSSITGNRLTNNYCNKACMTIKDTEKDFEFAHNIFNDNYGRSMLEINMHSHTPYTQWVDSVVGFNVFRNNHPPQQSGSSAAYTLSMKGLQNATINRNVFVNPDMPYELLCAFAYSEFENYLDATENWWNTVDAKEIEERILDFEDWNSYAIAEYSPVLSSDALNTASSVPLTKPRKLLDYSKPLGGKVEEFVNLTKRSQPYIIERDLTIMPGYSMVIEKGTEVKVAPDVGLLVLGALSTFGSESQPIKFTPLESHKRVKRSDQKLLPYLDSITKHQDVDQVIGYQLRLMGGENGDGGFLEIYNNTEQKWVIVCDDAFNDRTAQVACKTMGKESSNVLVDRSRYYSTFVWGYPKMHDQIIEWFWRETLICEGDENDLNGCEHKINYNLPTCMEQRRYVYLRCGVRNLEKDLDYWGGIRFAHLHGQNDVSLLQHMDLVGAGRLHGERVAAVQSVKKSLQCDSVRIQSSGWNGFDFIAPSDALSVKNSVVQNSYGYGIGVVVLNGQTSEEESRFEILKNIDLPVALHGVIVMCSVQKMLLVRNRVLLYHKYSFDTIDCIKVLRSKEPRRQIGIRLLQFNLFNDSIYQNSLQIFEGEFFEPDQLIVTLNYNSTEKELKKFYRVSEAFDTIGIRITASAAYGAYGFVAEVVTLPISPTRRTDYGNLRSHMFIGNKITNNLRGGLMYRNVGEDSPRIIVQRNFIYSCGTKVLNNTEPGAIDMHVQNTRLLTISNNHLDLNAGGIRINTTTKDHQSSLYANITNNICSRTSHAPALHIEGHYFQSFLVKHNHINNNHLAFRNVIYLRGVQMNFSSNIVSKNSAQCIFNASVPKKIDINHHYTYNSIYHNHAHEYARSTFFLKSAKFHLSKNFILNPLNIFDIITHNRTKYLDGMYPEIQAMDNWWGRAERSYVEGRVWDRLDDDNLIRVKVEPFIKNNKTLLDGKCYPGWRWYQSKCYMYFGGVTTYDQASKLCRARQGRLAWARDATGKEKELGDIVARKQFDYGVHWRTWVYSDNPSATCTNLIGYTVHEGRCSDLLPFICEKDPYIQSRMNWLPIIITIVISLIVIIFIIFPLIIFGCIKSSQRKDEKSERKVTLARSLAASRQSLDQLESSTLPLRPYPSQEMLKIGIPEHEKSTSYKQPIYTDTSSEYDQKSRIWSDTTSFTSKASSKRARPPLNMPPNLENQVPTITPRVFSAQAGPSGRDVRKRGFEERKPLKYDSFDEYDDDYESRI